MKNIRYSFVRKLIYERYDENNFCKKTYKDKDLLEAINELGIGFYYKKLVESNHRFNKLYLERNKEYASA
ncbi:MAG: hypothetical protein KGY70_19050, partial [Bacteroidales bacterium]|nr:hypothetical protein [Bacteroidales bacterium]